MIDTTPTGYARKPRLERRSEGFPGSDQDPVNSVTDPASNSPGFQNPNPEIKPLSRNTLPTISGFPGFPAAVRP